MAVVTAISTVAKYTNRAVYFLTRILKKNRYNKLVNQFPQTC